MSSHHISRIVFLLYWVLHFLLLGTPLAVNVLIAHDHEGQYVYADILITAANSDLR